MQYSTHTKLAALFLSALLFVSQSCLAEYIELEPAFVVNLSSDDAIKFAQVSVQVRVANSEAANAIETHNPAIRHALVMLLSSKTPEEASTRQGKEMLRTEAAETIRKVLEEQHVKFTPVTKEDQESKENKNGEKTTEDNVSPIQDVFFTRFIIQ